MSFDTFADELDEEMRPAAPALIPSDAPAGTIGAGTIINAVMEDYRNYDTNKVEYWDNGKPKRQVILTVQTEPDPTNPNDDGRRTIYIKMWGAQKKALATAIKLAGFHRARDIVKPGTFIQVTFKGTEDVQGRNRTYTQKVWEYELIPGATQEMDNTLTPQPPAQQAPAPQAPAPQAPAPQAQAQAQGNPWNNTQPPAQAATVQAPEAQICNLLANGMTPEAIHQFMGIPLEVIQQYA